MPDLSVALDKLHCIHLKNGCFSSDTQTHAGDIDLLLDSFATQSPPAGMAMHFHGGLVSLKSGKEIADHLAKEYELAGAYPVFFLWESGAFETVSNNLKDISKEPIFHELVRKVVEFVLGRLGDAIGGKGGSGAVVDPVQVAQVVDKWFADASGDPPYADFQLQSQAAGGKAASVSDLEFENAVVADLEMDPRVKSALEHVQQGLFPAGQTEEAPGGGQLAAHTTLMEPKALDEILESRQPGEKGLISTAKLALAIIKLVRAVVSRFLGGRDHGLYGTVVEEIYRQMYVDKIGQAFLWNQMKKDTADAFAPSGAPGKEPGGTEFLSRLGDRLKAGAPKPRITLIGHSTGAVYICHFLEAADKYLPMDVSFDIVFLAPAVDFQLFRSAIEKYRHRVGHIRMFGMTDALELDDPMAQDFLGVQLARVVYPHSLLYFVSGLLEGREVDTPILGMQRFFDRADIFDQEHYPELQWARDELSGHTVWSISDVSDGRRSASRQHGDFDNDEATLASLRHILKVGYQP
ncbi:MAG: hypothetical protein PHR30_15005 [Gallionellaceae bacterium]|nr:hypothetical protein [Gallionellaceae bacterium]